MSRCPYAILHVDVWFLNGVCKRCRNRRALPASLQANGRLARGVENIVEDPLRARPIGIATQEDLEVEQPSIRVTCTKKSAKQKKVALQ